MIQKKNKLMLQLSLLAVLLSMVVHLLERTFQLFHSHASSHMGAELAESSNFTTALNILLITPIILLIYCAYLYVRNKEHPLLPLLITLVMTFSSFSIISGSGGGIEFHFSIFMVVATTAYYENIKLILMMTLLFAIQHIAGFFLIPELVFGTTSYSFIMLSIHAGFLILTSSATTLQIISKKKITQELEAEKNAKQSQLVQLLDSVRQLSDELEQSSMTVSSKSELTTRMNEEMNLSFKEVSSGLETQSESINSIENNLQTINHIIIQTAHSSNEIKVRATGTGDFVLSNEQNMRSLHDQTMVVSKSIETATTALSALVESSQRIEGILSTVQDVANQTNLLALNASIEAARAGEHGKGFSVVATEIRKLAERTSESTQEIHSILSMIQGESNDAVKHIEDGKQASALSVAKAEETIASFVHMAQDLQQVIQLVTHLNDSIGKIESGSSEISAEVSTISSFTQESVASMEQLFALSESQVISYKEVNEEISQLKQLAQSLYRQISA